MKGFAPNGLTNSIETDIVGTVCKIRDVQTNIEGVTLWKYPKTNELSVVRSRHRYYEKEHRILSIRYLKERCSIKNKVQAKGMS